MACVEKRRTEIWDVENHSIMLSNACAGRNRQGTAFKQSEIAVRNSQLTACVRFGEQQLTKTLFLPPGGTALKSRQ